MKMVKNIAIVAFATSFMFANIGFHMGNVYSEMDDATAVTTTYGATYSLNDATSIGYDSSLGMLMYFTVPAGVTFRLCWDGEGNDDGTSGCDGDDTRMVLSDSNAEALESNFIGSTWTVGSNTLDNDAPEIYSYSLSSNYPNPFNPSTTIDYSIANAGEVSIAVYDMMGRYVRTLVSDFATPGSYTIVWDAKNDEGLSVSAGMYIYKMASGDFVQVNKMLLIK